MRAADLKKSLSGYAPQLHTCRCAARTMSRPWYSDGDNLCVSLSRALMMTTGPKPASLSVEGHDAGRPRNVWCRTVWSCVTVSVEKVLSAPEYGASDQETATKIAGVREKLA